MSAAETPQFMEDPIWDRDRRDLLVDRLKGHLAAAGAKAVESRELRGMLMDIYISYISPPGGSWSRQLWEKESELSVDRPGKPGPKPSRRLDLVVDVLVDYWERKCGPFSADWTKRTPSEQSRQPLTNATRFVCDVVEFFLGSERLREMPKTIDRVRARRKAARATSPIRSNRGSDFA
jgi:hypothetical protein